MTLRQAEEETGLSKDTISRLERGLRTPQPLTVGKLAEAYGHPIEEFLENPKVQAPPPLDSGDERGHYPYPWMGDTLARTIDGWVKQTEVPPENPMFSYAISVGAIDVLQEVLRYDIPGETLGDRVPEDELGERIQLAKKLDRVLRRANEHYAANKDADSAEVRELFDAAADIRRRTKEIA
jgi:transcriptional regulator with XRE-family HTH domain